MPASEHDRLGDLYAVHADEARRFALLLCGDEQTAQDVVQEAFVRVASRLSGLRNPESFRWYLRRTIRNLVRMQARSDRRAAAREARAHTAGDTAPAEPSTGRTQYPELWAALDALSERQRAALVCRFYLELSERDTARILRCRNGTVRSLVSRGLATLRTDRRLLDDPS